ncbi:hypothetical protein [Pelagibaculum spongiae]|uniref:Uncharacterized protein n=1 Tax=Pelagibaculum spongiae TaxID=2080658 RepID=A0A2V1GZH2_9GAMM|nr:hypothetical protein [Pelagibaculum spongiae]PVZ71573.1 hypothetical protein DC094_00585 [Pelagibaculum spongiae]
MDFQRNLTRIAGCKCPELTDVNDVDKLRSFILQKIGPTLGGGCLLVSAEIPSAYEWLMSVRSDESEIIESVESFEWLWKVNKMGVCIRFGVGLDFAKISDVLALYHASDDKYESAFILYKVFLDAESYLVNNQHNIHYEGLCESAAKKHYLAYVAMMVMFSRASLKLREIFEVRDYKSIKKRIEEFMGRRKVLLQPPPSGPVPTSLLISMSQDQLDQDEQRLLHYLSELQRDFYKLRVNCGIVYSLINTLEKSLFLPSKYYSEIDGKDYMKEKLKKLDLSKSNNGSCQPHLTMSRFNSKAMPFGGIRDLRPKDFLFCEFVIDADWF